VDGKPKKSDYKRFKVEGLADQDDYESMRQVLCRRFCHYLDGDKGFSECPDALLIDGGVVHAQVVQEALSAMGIRVPIFGMVKDNRHRTRALVTPEGGEIGIQGNPAIFSFIGRIQEETHRFAIEYHRSLRDSISPSKLEEIPGIGEKRRSLLWERFGSLRAVKAATEKELAAVLGPKTARTVYDYFHKSKEEEPCE
jgi:excinuclease ABC subunit C